MNLEDSILEIKGIGEKSAILFHKMNIETVSDLLFHIPKRFETFEEACYVDDCSLKEIANVKGILRPGSIRVKKTGRYVLTTVVINSNERSVCLRFFNMPYLKNVLLPNINYVFRGTLQFDKDTYRMLQPKIYKETDYNTICGTLQPVYTLTKGISNHAVSKAAKNALEETIIPYDFINEDEQRVLKLMPLNQAVYSIHFPGTEEEWLQARRRLVFNEFFFFLYQMKREDNNQKKLPFSNPLLPVADTRRLMEALPYQLTSAQKQVFHDIEEDMQSNYCMNRLIQGDVGSGKTIIAILSLLLCAANNRQGCFMAPTEVLAKQHFDTISLLCKQYKLPIRPVLLLGSMSAKEKREIRTDIIKGTYNVIIGTQALIQKSVEYNNLALVITDEQHRFGVRQREALANKSTEVHVLVMSATPIPRTLAMILYGNLATSLLNEMPVGRIPIKNCVIEPKLRNKSYQFIVDEVKKGRQAYIICPMVESVDEEDELENVIDYTEKLREFLPNDISIAFLHGKMSLKEKSEIMDHFSNHEIDILVSTTVIEVGINVPNATVMMVENAQRYGLAQLHQLRGRVGRGKEQSYCIFITTKSDEKTMNRLNVLLESNDGFYIADKDLQLRGPGDLFGIRQSGELGFQIGDIYQDSDILMTASEFVNKILMTAETGKTDAICNFMKMLRMNSVDFRTI